jgi:hypothetical protein
MICELSLGFVTTFELFLDGRCRFGGGIGSEAVNVGPLGIGIGTLVFAASFFTDAKADAFLFGAIAQAIRYLSGDEDGLNRTRRRAKRKDTCIQCKSPVRKSMERKYKLIFFFSEHILSTLVSLRLWQVVTCIRW